MEMVCCARVILELGVSRNKGGWELGAAGLGINWVE